jgi:ribonuclease HI
MYEVWADGACIPNPGLGGAAAVIKELDGTYTTMTFSHPKTNSVRMEYVAVLMALHALPNQSHIQVFTDSELLVNTMTKWAPKWTENHFQKKKTADLVKLLLVEVARMQKVEWFWVKGHSGIELNEICDKLSVEAALKNQGRIKRKIGPLVEKRAKLF